MRRSSIRIVLAILAVAVGVGLAAALVFRPWEANRRPPIIGVAHKTEILIAPDVNGRMTPFRVAAGQAVRKGDTLAVLSNPDLAAAVEEAKADLATARANEANVLAGVRQEEIDAGAQNVQIADANLAFAQQQYARAATLASKGFTSKQQLDESTATFSEDQAAPRAGQSRRYRRPGRPDRRGARHRQRDVVYAEAALADAEASLAKSTLVAPVDGVVSLVANPSEIISPGQPIMTLEAANKRWFTFTVREDLLQGTHYRLPRAVADGERRPDRRQGHRAAAARRIRGLARCARGRRSRPQQFLLRADTEKQVRSVEPGMTVWIDRIAAN